MNRPLLRLVLGGGLLIVLLGSGPCPGCYDDECSPKGETWCQDGVAFFCAEPNDNGAYALLREDCAAIGQTCRVVDETEEGPGPRAICVGGCPDGGACGDAAPCEGDQCVSDAGQDGAGD